MDPKNKEVTHQFIEDVWNQQHFDRIDHYLHPRFIDHSLPIAFPKSIEGTQRWIIATSASFEHRTIVEEIVSEDDKVMVKIRMMLKHVGTWRGIAPTHIQLSATGFRYFKLAEDKIIGHWALIDGNSIEQQLKAVPQAPQPEI